MCRKHVFTLKLREKRTMQDRETFGRPQRLLQKADFTRVFHQGQRLSGYAFTCYIAPAESHARLGLAVSRKVGKAVVRNRVKRYVRECFRRRRPHFRRPVEMVIVAHRESASLDGRECHALLQRLWHEGGVL